MLVYGGDRMSSGPSTPLATRVRQVYDPPRLVEDSGFSLGRWLGAVHIRWCAYGRIALRDALLALRVQPGDRVLVPDLICRDVLSALHAVGARAVYYRVNRALVPDEELANLGPAKACLVVNYFGFPQDLAPFEAVAARHGTVLIEDNAHGLYSADSTGRRLGTRTPLAIFSFRKTIPVPHGAALVCHADDGVDRSIFDEALPEVDDHASLRVRMKEVLRSQRWCGPRAIQVATPVLRALRGLLPVSAGNPEQELPPECFSPSRLASALARIDIAEECLRRRELYAHVAELLAPLAVKPIFSALAPGTVPMVYPFYCAPDAIGPVQRRLARHGLECFAWPDLPAAVRVGAPDYYSMIWGVRFLW